MEAINTLCKNLLWISRLLSTMVYYENRTVYLLTMKKSILPSLSYILSIFLYAYGFSFLTTGIFLKYFHISLLDNTIPTVVPELIAQKTFDTFLLAFIGLFS